MRKASKGDEASGLPYALGAYLAWGLVPLYFRALAGVSPLEILAHRVVWSVAVLALILAAAGRLANLWDAFRRPRALLALTATAILLGGNWFVFITAVERGEVLQASLGYFINPLVSVLLGFFLLGERLRPLQWLSVSLAGAGVVFLAAGVGRFPWISLFLAVTFALYGLLRKTAPVAPLEGLAVETLLGAGPSAAYLAYLAANGTGVFLAGNQRLDLLLLAAGLVTTLPLLAFATAARRLPLSTVGLLQYVAPTLQFLVAVFVFGEPFGRSQLVSFALIWAGLALFTGDALTRLFRRLGAPGLAAPPASPSNTRS